MPDDDNEDRELQEGEPCGPAALAGCKAQTPFGPREDQRHDDRGAEETAQPPGLLVVPEIRRRARPDEHGSTAESAEECRDEQQQHEARSRHHGCEVDARPDPAPDQFGREQVLPDVHEADEGGGAGGIDVL